AEAAGVGGGLRVADDADALAGRAVENSAEGAATVRYEIEVPRPGQYLLCGRVRAAPAARPVHLTVNDFAHFDCPLAPGSQYHTSCIGPPLQLAAGKHSLAITVTGPGVRLDSFELLAWIP